MATFMPLISSGTAGSLGVLHLPRLWLKSSREARSILDSRYPGAGKGFDRMTLDALGLDRDAPLAYIKSGRPSYPQFEQWIRHQPGARLDSATIDAHNASVLRYDHDDATREIILQANGLADDGEVRDAVRLNDLDSWLEFHEDVLK